MRGKPQAQPDILTAINLNAYVPVDHPLQGTKRRVDAVLKQLSPLLDRVYEATNRRSRLPG